MKEGERESYSFICLHGSAQGVWKFSATTVVGGTPSMRALNCSTVVMLVTSGIFGGAWLCW